VNPEIRGENTVLLGSTPGFGVQVRTDANTEEVEENTQDGEGRDRKDHASEPAKLATADHRQEHDDRADVERLSLDARREEVALELLDQDVGHDGQHGDGRGLLSETRSRSMVAILVLHFFTHVR
jgi:hypothetical protein